MITLSPSRYGSLVSKMTWSLTAGLRRSCHECIYQCQPGPCQGAKLGYLEPDLTAKGSRGDLFDHLRMCWLPASEAERSAFRSEILRKLTWRMSPASETSRIFTLTENMFEFVWGGCLGSARGSIRTYPGLMDGNWSASPTIKFGIGCDICWLID